MLLDVRKPSQHIQVDPDLTETQTAFTLATLHMDNSDSRQQESSLSPGEIVEQST